MVAGLGTDLVGQVRQGGNTSVVFGDTTDELAGRLSIFKNWKCGSQLRRGEKQTDVQADLVLIELRNGCGVPVQGAGNIKGLPGGGPTHGHVHRSHPLHNMACL